MNFSVLGTHSSYRPCSTPTLEAVHTFQPLLETCTEGLRPVAWILVADAVGCAVAFPEV